MRAVYACPRNTTLLLLALAALPGAQPLHAAEAPAPKHWAFQPVRCPPVPAVKNSAWVRNPIDAFVLARLEARGWQPASPAGPGALLRRMYLDVTGLPPTPQEQDAFLQDPSPEAF